MLDLQKTVGEVGEKALLRHLRARVPSGIGVVLGIGDDAAAVETGGLSLIAGGAHVEGVHFRAEWSPAVLIGRKALTAVLCDVAAMGGLPRYASVSLCLRPDTGLGFVDGLYDGLLERCAETGVSLVGGNISAIDGPTIVHVALLGYADRLLKRSGSQPGDAIVVTGRLGAATAGFQLLKQGARLGDEGNVESTGLWTEGSAAAVRHCLKAQLDPAPPLAFARLVSEQDLARAAIDVSDGLSGDLLALCQESGVAARLEAAAIPIDAHAAGLEKARGGDPLWLALHGGEDYQLLLAVAPERMADLRDHAQMWDTSISMLGHFREGAPGLELDTGSEILPLTPASHEHFKARAVTLRRA